MGKPDGGPAFPDHNLPHRHNGMSLRDYFAGQVVGSIAEIYRNDNGVGVGSEHFPRNAAAHAYALADAMLAERERHS